MVSVEPSGTPTTTTYGYSTGDWGDLLTSFNGSGITYDTIGNPLTYYGSRSFTWEGRRLVGATASSKALTFKYNDEGLRTSKTVSGVTTNYYYNGSQLIAEETNGNITLYMYNSTGIVGFRYRTSSYAKGVWDTYLYEKNLQGDIVAVYDSNGTKKISYIYDAWGNFTATYHNGASATNLFNPYTYRGYYYDKDLSLYYLSSRYYDSNTGRFINADDTLYNSMLGYNMFAYCNNNPVNFYDPTGQSTAALLWGWLTGAGTVAAAEPTPVGEIVLVVGAIIISGIWLVEELEELGEVISDKISEPPKSITETEKNANSNEQESEELDKNGYPVVKPGQLPTEKDGYIAPKNGPMKGKTKDGKIGWKDKNGNIWVPAPTDSPLGHGGGHWDVQSPKGGYSNVYPGGKIRGGKAPYPNIPIFPR